jgi:mono/diheme cytochrome c family protein
MTIRNAVVSLGMMSLMAIGAAAQTTVKQTPVTRTSPASGKEMFTSYCAVCHGPSGKGDGPAANALTKKPADLTQLTAKNGG